MDKAVAQAHKSGEPDAMPANTTLNLRVQTSTCSDIMEAN